MFECEAKHTSAKMSVQNWLAGKNYKSVGHGNLYSKDQTPGSLS